MTLTPESKALLALNHKAMPVPMSEMDVQSLRALMTGINVPSRTDIFEVTDVQATTRAGSATVRVYRPSNATNLPILMYLHGGGFAIGDLEMHDEYLRNLSNAAHIVIASVEYRLAPENPYPAGIDDCFDVWSWLKTAPPEVPGDIDRMGVAGDSAGGSLALAVTLRARDMGVPVPAVVVTAYATTEMRVSNPELGSREINLLTNEDCTWFWDMYTTDPAERSHPYCNVAEATDLSGLGANLVITAEYDPTRDATEDYASRLEAAGNPVVLTRYDGQLHGFFPLLNLPAAQRSLTQTLAFLEEHL